MRTQNQIFLALLRGAALFSALFAFANLAGGSIFPNFDANYWWIDFYDFDRTAGNLILAAFVGLAFLFAVRPKMGTVRKALSVAAFSMLGMVALINALGFFRLACSDLILAGFLVPFSFGVALFLGLLTYFSARRESDGLNSSKWIVGGFTASVVLFPFLQMLCFGKTDYRRQADAAVVFGARVYADGELSDALADRVNTACELYRDGFVQKLIMSGGPGDGPVHETEAMKRFAMERGVRPEHIILDRNGLNTRATVENTTANFGQFGIRRVLAVSHFYHLPRVKLSYRRAGWEVYTVPARCERVLLRLPIFMAREIAALGKYYFQIPAEPQNRGELSFAISRPPSASESRPRDSHRPRSS